jgi:cytochrome oxidase Cu insertion factor (SCO1/SenC/PrrC family)
MPNWMWWVIGLFIADVILVIVWAKLGKVNKRFDQASEDYFNIPEGQRFDIVDPSGDKVVLYGPRVIIIPKEDDRCEV